MKTLIYRPVGGTNIEHACNEAVKMARQGDCMVRFDFNGVELVASGRSDPKALSDSFLDEMNKRAEAYKKSPEGIQDAENRRLLVESNNLKAAELIRNLPALLVAETLNDLMGWLKQFAVIADDIGTRFDHRELRLALESAGYKNNEGVGQPPEWFNTRERMGRYIVGQVIDCLSTGMPPHPITLSFIGKYEALPR